MSDEPLFLSREDAARKAGVGFDTIKRAINKGTLRAKRTSVDSKGNPAGKYLITVEALKEWHDGLADA